MLFEVYFQYTRFHLTGFLKYLHILEILNSEFRLNRLRQYNMFCQTVFHLLN